MTRTLKHFLLLVGVAGFFVVGCKKDKTPPTVPSITTTAATNVTTTTAKSGGTITDNGRATITEAGVVYSSTNATPTITDSKKTATATSGSFTVDLDGLNSGSTYYVRAYATNSVGTAYGQVEQFNTGNAAPEARSITINGNKAVDEKLTARYTYFDAENNPESGTTFQWYIANDTIGATVTAISGATDSIYKLVTADKDKFIRVGVTAKASAGTSPGTEMKSYWVGPVGAEYTTVTFTYNGQQVTYGIITSPQTGRKWMDRNLGAPAVASSINDYLNAGDLFQWGRRGDGHQLVTRTSQTTASIVNGTTNTVSQTTVPGHSQFIISSQSNQYDWYAPHDSTLWNPERSGNNNPCPSGWHIPQKAEWLAENIGTADLLFSQLKLPLTGNIRSSGSFSSGTTGYYWSSSANTSAGNPPSPVAQRLEFNPTYEQFGVYPTFYGVIRMTGSACRCIKD